MSGWVYTLLYLKFKKIIFLPIHPNHFWAACAPQKYWHMPLININREFTSLVKQTRVCLAWYNGTYFIIHKVKKITITYRLTQIIFELRAPQKCLYFPGQRSLHLKSNAGEGKNPRPPKTIPSASSLNLSFGERTLEGKDRKFRPEFPTQKDRHSNWLTEWAKFVKPFEGKLVSIRVSTKHQ